MKTEKQPPNSPKLLWHVDVEDKGFDTIVDEHGVIQRVAVSAVTLVPYTGGGKAHPVYKRVEILVQTPEEHLRAHGDAARIYADSSMIGQTILKHLIDQRGREALQATEVKTQGPSSVLKFPRKTEDDA